MKSRDGSIWCRHFVGVSQSGTCKQGITYKEQSWFGGGQHWPCNGSVGGCPKYEPHTKEELLRALLSSPNRSGWDGRRGRSLLRARLLARAVRVGSCDLVGLPAMATFTLIAQRKAAQGGWNEETKEAIHIRRANEANGVQHLVDERNS